MKEIERHFRPEFIGRLDDVVVFRPLNRANLENVIEIESTKKVTKRLTDHGLKDRSDAGSQGVFARMKGTNADFGASRPAASRDRTAR